MNKFAKHRKQFADYVYSNWKDHLQNQKKYRLQDLKFKTMLRKERLDERAKVRAEQAKLREEALVETNEKEH